MLNVMLVDNEAIICKGLMHCIDWEELGCAVISSASDGLEALEKMRICPADIVVSDIRMPSMDGLTLAERLCADYPETKVIILTGFPDFSYAQRAIAYRVVDFVLKPTSAEKLRAAVTKAIEQLSQERGQRAIAQGLQVKDAENIRLRQDMLLYDLIFGAPSSMLYAVQRGGELGLNLMGYYIIRLAVYLCGECDSMEYDFTKPLQEAQGLMRRAFADMPINFVSCGGRACYAFVASNEHATLTGSCYEVARIAASLTDFTVSFGISLYHNNPTQMRHASAEADSAQLFAAANEGVSVMRYSDQPTLSAEDGQWVSRRIKLFSSALENGSATQTREIYSELCKFLDGAPLTQARRVYTIVYNLCVSLLYDYTLEASDLREQMLHIDHALQEDSAETISLIIGEFLRGAITYINHNTANMDGVIASAQTYIGQHYADELSLEHLAGIVHLSPSYLSKLFKKETGENISGYIQSVRIERAKVLLRTTDKKTYEIAEEVGIDDPVYFSRIFKKLTGLKPREYKMQEQADT